MGGKGSTGRRERRGVAWASGPRFDGIAGQPARDGRRSRRRTPARPQGGVQRGAGQRLSTGVGAEASARRVGAFRWDSGAGGKPSPLPSNPRHPPSLPRSGPGTFCNTSAGDYHGSRHGGREQPLLSATVGIDGGTAATTRARAGTAAAAAANAAALIAAAADVSVV